MINKSPTKLFVDLQENGEVTFSLKELSILLQRSSGYLVKYLAVWYPLRGISVVKTFPSRRDQKLG